MPNLTLRDVPEDLRDWLKKEAAAHHRSVNEEILAVLEAARGAAPGEPRRASAEELLAIGRRAARLRRLDRRSEDEILGYGEDGLPG